MSGAVPGRVGCASVVGIEGRESGVPKGAERFQTGHEAAGPGKGVPGVELDAFLQVPTSERLTPYLSAIRSPIRGTTVLRRGYGDNFDAPGGDASVGLSRLCLVNADVVHLTVVRQIGLLNLSTSGADFLRQLDVFRQRRGYLAALSASNERLKMSSGAPSAEIDTSSLRFR